MNPDRAAFRERLGMYLLGLAIGCVMLGLIFAMKNQMARYAPGPAPPPVSTTPR